MRRVIVESPFAVAKSEVEAASKSGEWTRVRYYREKHRRYLRALALWCIGRGDSPYASHAMITNWLNDDDPTQRKIGIDLCFPWAAAAEAAVIGVDLGISDGMRYGIKRHTEDQRPLEYVKLGALWETWQDSYPHHACTLDVQCRVNPDAAELTALMLASVHPPAPAKP